jgi:hypothetical protein
MKNNSKQTEIKKNLYLKKQLRNIKKIQDKNLVYQLLKQKDYSVNFISGQKAVIIDNNNSNAKR